MNIEEELQLFCANIRYLRKANKLSQAEMATRLRTSVRTVRMLEQGVVPVRLSCEVILNAYCAFKVPPNVLLGAVLGEPDKNL